MGTMWEKVEQKPKLVVRQFQADAMTVVIEYEGREIVAGDV